ncbi:pimeloyl-ACP methyl ester carboxylesterase [Pseudorhizobium tarimense]|uniref:Pimeloyl-ACP methyl ester carboxylesterase n=1 Tax=Pseudorhizobium tarimense TaxID=1079109 RepID=A0ABV2H7S0_9HYPH|nr:alpha/beta hydrolase [Pseudorhizobium tarimense]MCJ8519554.1 alpha/beta hydrolase [Pseudorhizobium tarimense]
MLHFVIAVPVVIAGVIAAAMGFSAWKAHAIEEEFPNRGELIDLGEFQMNSLHIPAGPDADLPPIVFIHGAGGNLRDQEAAFRPSLEGRAELLFVDRPGHGYSERGGEENAWPDGQAAAIASLMEARGIDKAIIVGHSFGGAVAASFGLYQPQKTIGLVLLAPATHPWPGGVDWYYELAAKPYIGWLFTRTVLIPAGLMRLGQATKSVFDPNPRPEEYMQHGAPALAVRPRNFRNNAIDVVNLNDYARRVAPTYHNIEAPTVIISGNRDGVVAEEIHSAGLKLDIDDSELVWVDKCGHKPDYMATEVAVAAIEKLAGRKRDLQTIASRLDVPVTRPDGVAAQAPGAPLEP